MAWYDFIYKIFKEGEDNKAYRESSRERGSTKELMKGADIFSATSGFGVTDMEEYLSRGDVQKSFKKIKEAELWKN